MRHLTVNQGSHADGHSRRGGSTLTEVLIAILAMSVGVAAVATMFPISVLKSVKATQLTHSAILRFNVDGLIDADRGLFNAVHDPNANGMIDPSSQSLGNRVRNPGQFPDALGDPGVIEHGNQRWIVDPLGWVQNQAVSSGYSGIFGNNGTTTPVQGFTMARLNAGRTTLLGAEELALLPDDWKTIGEWDTATFTSTASESTITLPASVDPTLITTIDGGFNPPTRIVLYGAVLNTVPNPAVLEKLQMVRLIKSRSGQDITVVPRLPAGYQIERFEIEQRDQQFTWMLTVRKDGTGTTANVDVAVFYRRSFDEKEERLIPTKFYNASTGANSISGRAEIDWSTLGFASGERPAYRKGGFVFDAGMAEWYRIQNVTEDLANEKAELQLDRLVSSRYPRSIPASVNTRAILMKGIVDVYHLPGKSIN